MAQIFCSCLRPSSKLGHVQCVSVDGKSYTCARVILRITHTQLTILSTAGVRSYNGHLQLTDGGSGGGEGRCRVLLGFLVCLSGSWPWGTKGGLLSLPDPLLYIFFCWAGLWGLVNPSLSLSLGLISTYLPTLSLAMYKRPFEILVFFSFRYFPISFPPGGWVEVVSHYSLTLLCFLQWFLGHMCFLFCILPGFVFCPSQYCFSFSFCLIIFRNYLYILDTNPLLVT